MAKKTLKHDEILREVLKVYMANSYEQVTVKKLEKATGITRGGLFYYARDMDDLFRQVVEKHLIALHQAEFDMKYKPDAISFRAFINHYIKGVIEINDIGLSYGLENLHKSYFNFLMQAVMHYEGMDKTAAESLAREKGLWVEQVRKAIVRKELRPDIMPTVVGEHFLYLQLGMALESAFTGEDYQQHLRRVINNYYNDLRAKETSPIDDVTEEER